MNESARITVTIDRDVLSRLDTYAASHRWSRSTAAAELIEGALPVGQDQGQQQGDSDGVD